MDRVPHSTPTPPSVAAPPRVAVIVPAYGVAHLLGEALESLQAQTCPLWECVVIDDGAPDDVAGAVAPFLRDPRIRFVPTANHGVSAARNRAVSETSAPLVALLDGDDLFRPTYLATMATVLENDPSLRIVTCNARLFGAVPPELYCVRTKQGHGDGTHGSLADVLDRSFNVYIGSMFRRADFDAIGGFDATMAQSEDLDLWVRLMLLGGSAYYVDEVLGDYRVRPGSASSQAVRMLLGTIKVYEKAGAALPANAPEQPLLAQLIAANRAALDFEYAIDRIVEGDTARGLSALRRCRGGQVSGLKWTLLFSLWNVLPGTARPLLQWRRRAHSRGAMGGLFSRPRAA